MAVQPHQGVVRSWSELGEKDATRELRLICSEENTLIGKVFDRITGQMIEKGVTIYSNDGNLTGKFPPLAFQRQVERAQNPIFTVASFETVCGPQSTSIWKVDVDRRKPSSLEYQSYDPVESNEDESDLYEDVAPLSLEIQPDDDLPTDLDEFPLVDVLSEGENENDPGVAVNRAVDPVDTIDNLTPIEMGRVIALRNEVRAAINDQLDGMSNAEKAAFADRVYQRIERVALQRQFYDAPMTVVIRPQQLEIVPPTPLGETLMQGAAGGAIFGIGLAFPYPTIIGVGVVAVSENCCPPDCPVNWILRKLNLR